MELPKVSILIPTLNSRLVLDKCLESIRLQNYPKDKLEVIVADGGSTDGTKELSQKYGATVIYNPLRTGEAGKACALKIATGDYVALIDSDNILPNNSWLMEMINPLLQHPEIVVSEPIYYTWRKEDGFITRYCALIGMNDPLVMFLGNYDRHNNLTEKWTEIPHEERQFDGYIIAKFSQGRLPTIGANGSIFRSDFLKNNLSSDYLFDIDVLYSVLVKIGFVEVIKVNNGIIHSYCESDIKKFIIKQKRRVMDYLFFSEIKKTRIYNWDSVNTWGIVKFVVSCITIFPLIGQSLVGFLKKRDCAWFFHLIACETTLFIYSYFYLIRLFGQKELSRENWKQ